MVPVHLSELARATIRATFPGFVYQLGNFLASGNATIQAKMGEAMATRAGDVVTPNYSWALAYVAGGAAIVITILMAVGKEARDIRMGDERTPL